MNNEPAFPVGRDVTQDQFAPSSGMTLRDYFAAKAMQANLNSFMSYGDNAEESLTRAAAKEIAAESYKMADAMMEARGES